jgi:lipopolysaccharide/colanic/teichoic acid biosynthesis glycosyltransferase
MIYINIVKPAIDFIFAVLALIFFFPFFVVLSILLAISNRGTPYFFQKRVGKNNAVFTILKFKTMTDEKDSKGQLLPDENRLTWIGNIVRKTSLDEMPQLLNVIKGHMSLVGPRPLLVDYLPLYNDFQKRRHELKPGVTGWVGVNGRNAISWEEKFNLDIWYVDNVSFLLDLKIIWMTIMKVIQSKDINQANQATMSRFDGN